MMVTTRLTDAEVEHFLQGLTGWSLDDAKLHSRFEFSNFEAAFTWMSKIAPVAERLNHHPEWLNVYRFVDVWLTTHDAGGITPLDFQLAREMNAAAQRRETSG